MMKNLAKVKAMRTKADEVKELVRAAFPDYRGNRISVKLFNGPKRLDSYWDGGCRDYFVFIHLDKGNAASNAVSVCQNGTVYDGETLKCAELPMNVALVQRTFSGNNQFVYVYVRQENLNLMIEDKPELSWAEKVCLCATRSYKSGYRSNGAQADTGITFEEWRDAMASLIERGLLNKLGALNDDGRNAIGDVQIYSLKRELAKV